MPDRDHMKNDSQITSVPVEVWTEDSDPPLTPAHRAYLRAFDDFLLRGGPRSAMTTALRRVLDEAGIDQPELADAA